MNQPLSPSSKEDANERYGALGKRAKAVQKSVALPPEMWARLQAISDENQCSVSQVIRRILREGLDGQVHVI